MTGESSMTTMKALFMTGESSIAKHSALLDLTKCRPSQTLAMNPLLFWIFITFL
jgi:hypothetical protein